MRAHPLERALRESLDIRTCDPFEGVETHPTGGVHALKRKAQFRDEECPMK
jgi:hypothetical protein